MKALEGIRILDLARVSAGPRPDALKIRHPDWGSIRRYIHQKIFISCAVQELYRKNAAKRQFDENLPFCLFPVIFLKRKQESFEG
ncbi:hypothetical protein HMPREF0083_01768 [Aneurinibacillus aneurinilyticus ATCC 12856]|uniref:Uncharacterized protein n=1 Tax=Aneurinibacillus aneurinilyticus ATCC 12856 TaxID=649747 RepID=U1WNH1_ANEAE|nr:hypothetical protein HMPREF0083_01768 [Aneurinibacillus aneurinilyticus ATCC 12856]